MLDQGNTDPIHKGLVVQQHMLTNNGQSLFHFLKNYRQMTGGRGRVPTRSIIAERFGPLAADLPETLGNEDLEALAYEVRLAKVRADLRDLSVNASIVADMADPVTELRKIRAQIDSITSEVSGGEDMDLDEAIDDITQDYMDGDILPDGMAWPWPTLTLATKGMHKGEFTVICGRPKSRKTFVAISVAAHAFLSGARVICVSPEMPPRQMMLRFIATVTFLRYAEFKNCALDVEEEERFISFAQQRNRVKKAMASVMRQVRVGENELTLSSNKAREDVPLGTEPKFVVIKGTGQGLGLLATKVEEYRPDYMLVDSFYRLAGSTGKSSHEADWKAITTVSRGLKDIAMAEGIHVQGTAQLNRDADQGPGSLANLALADAIGQDADAIIRAVTAKRMRTPDKTGLLLLGARETKIDGVLINNVPCSDFSEIEEIKNQKKVFDMLTEEEQQENAEEEAEANASKVPPVQNRDKRARVNRDITSKKSAPQKKKPAPQKKKTRRTLSGKSIQAAQRAAQHVMGDG